MTNGRRMSYAVVTPVRNDAHNLEALASCVLAQTRLPEVWVIVDDGSVDATAEVAARLSSGHDWINVVSLTSCAEQARGGPVVRAFTAGLATLSSVPDVVVKLDADLTFVSDYFERLLLEFESDPRLGIASGVSHERVDGEWRPSFGTRAHVWGAARAYRRDCLEHVLPLEERQGWDEVDALKARLRGWTTRVVPDLPFRHHRRMGDRDGRRGVWRAQGETAYYMGYRPSYLLVRTLYRLLQEPQALLMLWGYIAALLRRQPQLPDPAVRGELRELQRLRVLPVRLREIRGDV